MTGVGFLGFDPGYGALKISSSEGPRVLPSTVSVPRDDRLGRLDPRAIRQQGEGLQSHVDPPTSSDPCASWGVRVPLNLDTAHVLRVK